MVVGVGGHQQWVVVVVHSNGGGISLWGEAVVQCIQLVNQRSIRK